MRVTKETFTNEVGAEFSIEITITDGGVCRIAIESVTTNMTHVMTKMEGQTLTRMLCNVYPESVPKQEEAE